MIVFQRLLSCVLQTNYLKSFEIKLSKKGKGYIVTIIKPEFGILNVRYFKGFHNIKSKI